MNNSAYSDLYPAAICGAEDSALPTEQPVCINSDQLLGRHGLVIINHQGQFYQLRQTKAGKLILTK
ncbi:hemin uptake protein HemP [Yersinia ruckeri]|uniref:Hemin uptake protein n=1 Tax=Yersinia ruckeri TaxID=29486 RepID=A0A0A8VI97_YERRU|nr:hemin uptake protein HemP [Yersinia ruckeri]EEQ00564.1 Hemin uptake protein [Yersinia ruckeri ATCC 29473]EKN3346419.1 hemin uptake protein HemP [Yersinia ruckeri]EKN3360915.1 hemin uptake protein HemP [Yersinia ruckeri]EKN4181236.1 hemin uptake protein HemP [Yersinia ruckeri]